MRKKIFRPLLVGVLSLGLLSSCSKFLDIQPKGTLLEEVQFSSIQGYQDAMYGVYGTLAGEGLYGGALTAGLMENLAQNVGNLNSVSVNYHINRYEYTNDDVRAHTDALWTQLYEVISYNNNILENLGRTSLSGDVLRLIKGEAYGLRAFLHFDVARLFAADYRRAKAAGKLSSTRGIPYAYHFDLKNKQVYNLEDTYKNILADLDRAEAILSSDETITGGDLTNANYQTHRIVHFNKYAVYATKARVYNAMGESAKAAAYAQKVIAHSSDFALAPRASFTDVVRFPAKGELICGLYAPKFLDWVATTYLATGGGGNVDQGRRLSALNALYASAGGAASIDNRQAAYYRQIDSYTQFIRLLPDRAQLASLGSTSKGIMLIRLPEMYYILAEATYPTDPTAAVEALNKVRDSRGLAPLTTANFSGQAAFDLELMREYLRETPGEGQSFHAIKHFFQPFPSLLGESTKPTEDMVTLPWPELERTYGNH